MEQTYNQCNRIKRAAIGLPIELSNMDHKNCMGIYFLWFGSKYYIGSTINLWRRSRTHEYTLNKEIDKIGTGSASIFNILNHVFNDLSVERGIMQLVHEVDTEEELVSAEQMFLNDSKDDENCLNYSFVAVRFDKTAKNLLVERLEGSIPDLIDACVFKLYYNEKYVIVKGKSLIGSIKSIGGAIKTFSKKPVELWDQEYLYYHFFDELLNKNPQEDAVFRIEVVLESVSHFNLLKAEQELLWESQFDQNCLNNTVDAYIPVYNEETEMYGWINRGSLLNFLKWKKKKLQDPELAKRVSLDQTDSLDHLEA